MSDDPGPSAGGETSPTQKEYHKPGHERRYERSEPGHSLEGYLHHVQATVSECSQAFEAFQYPRKGQHESLLLFLLNAGFSNSRDRLKPYIETWHVELVTVASGLHLLAEVAPQLEKMEVALTALWQSVNHARAARPKAAQLPHKDAYEVATGQKAAPANMVVPPLDGIVIQDRLQVAYAQIERLQRLWPYFDPARDRVDRALVPFEDFYRQSVEVLYGLNDAVHRTTEESVERRHALRRLSAVVDGALGESRKAAIEHALTPVSASLLGPAMQVVIDNARSALASSFSANQHADRGWAAQIEGLSASIISLQACSPALRQAVEDSRAAVLPIRIQVVPATPAPSTRAAEPPEPPESAAATVTEAEPHDPGPSFVFRIDNKKWIVRFHDEEGRFDLLDGFDYLGQLIRNPNQRIQALQLMAQRRRNTGTAYESLSVLSSSNDFDQATEDPGTGSGRADLCLSEEALNNLHERIAEAKWEVANAEKRVAQAKQERDEPRAERLERDELHLAQEKLRQLELQLKRDTNWRGQSRTLGASDPARARETIRHVISNAIERMHDEGMVNCALHFKRNTPPAVGSGFIYNPDPMPEWITG